MDSNWFTSGFELVCLLFLKFEVSLVPLVSDLGPSSLLPDP